MTPISAFPLKPFYRQLRFQGYVTYTIYLLLGSGLLFPWNAFITAADYFESEFPVRLGCMLQAGASPVLCTVPGHSAEKCMHAGPACRQAHYCLLPAHHTGHASGDDPLQSPHKHCPARFGRHGRLLHVHDSSSLGEPFFLNTQKHPAARSFYFILYILRKC